MNFCEPPLTPATGPELNLGRSFAGDASDHLFDVWVSCDV